MKVAFCSAEVFPFAKTGGLADVCGTLPLELEKQDVPVSIFMPGYKTIDRQKFAFRKVRDELSVGIWGKNIQVYLIEHDAYFGREGIYGDQYGIYHDNLERFQYFCDQTLKIVKSLNEHFDVVHCHDWHAALIPVYLKERYPQDDFYRKIKTVLTIHNLAYQGDFPEDLFYKLNLNGDHGVWDRLTKYGKINILKAGIVYSDEVTTVSQRYAEEIQTEAYGCGLQDDLHRRQNRLVGILNGLDHTVWDPQKDTFLAKKYSSKNLLSAKEENKRQLQERLGLTPSPKIPLFGFVGRLVHQKGIDLILEVLPELLKEGVQVIIQGIGDASYQSALQELASRNTGRLAVLFEYNEPFAHQIYAGCDFFLMPSRFEPCGLSQMISMRYGTLPIVFWTGGLAETVRHFSESGQGANGLALRHYTKEDFLTVLRKASTIYNDEVILEELRKNAFHSDFSWKESAKEYKKLYQCLLSD